MRECICDLLICKRDCELCKEFGSCVPTAFSEDGPTDKDRRRDEYSRHRNGTG